MHQGKGFDVDILIDILDCIRIGGGRNGELYCND